MKFVKVCILTLVLVCITSWGVAADASKASDETKIQGDWIARSASNNGHPIAEAAGCLYSFHGDKLTIRDKTGKEMKYSFKLDTTSKPRLFVLHPEAILTNATVCSVAYQLDGDMLKTAMACPGSRPTGVSDTNNQMLITLERKTP